MHFSVNRNRKFLFIFFVLILSTTVFADRLKWQASSDNYITGGIEISNGYIYASALNTFIKMYDYNGKVVWERSVEGWLLKPIAYRNMIIVASKEGNLYTMDRGSGNVIRKIELGAEVLGDMLIKNGIAYVPTEEGVIAVDLSLGSVRWKQLDACRVHATPVEFNGKLLVLCENGEIALYSASSGARIDSVKYNEVFGKAKPVISDGRIIIGSYNGKIYSVSKNSIRTVGWKKNTVDGTAVSNIVIDEKGYVITTVGGWIYKIDTNGDIVWKIKTTSEVSAEPIITDKWIYAISDDGNAYGIDKNGTLKWMYETGVSTRFDVLKKGSTLYMISRNGTIAAISTTSCNFVFPEDGTDISGIDLLDVEVDAYADTKISNVEVRIENKNWISAEYKDGIYSAKIDTAGIGKDGAILECRVTSEDGVEQKPYNGIFVKKSGVSKKLNVNIPNFVGYGNKISIIVNDENGNPLDHLYIKFGNLVYRNVDRGIVINPPKKGKYVVEVRRAGYVPFKTTVEVGDDYTLIIVGVISAIILISILYILYKRWMEE